MKKIWLDMRPYGLHLFMARHPNGTDHNLVITGPGCARYSDRIAALGFERDSRFAHQEYWIRSIKGMTTNLIKGQFERAQKVMMPVENIMPALQARNPVQTTQATIRSPQERTNELGQTGTDRRTTDGNADRA